MDRSAKTEVAIHETLTRRWSPYGFDAGRDVAEADVRALLEAARWTMSSYNEQPWRYVVGSRSRSREVWEKVLGCLVEANQTWARNAPVLMLGLVEHEFARNGKTNKAATHDLGAASASLTVEATARGLSVHQMIGIEPDRAREVFGVSGSLEPLTGLAVGYAADAAGVDPELAKRDARERVRKDLSEIVIAGSV